MSAHTTQNYYLINLSTRTVSISTHLRGDNYTLKPGKCIYLGSVTDELILKYNKYSVLNICLRIVTKDKLCDILNKSINLTNNQIKEILDGSIKRVEHTAGSISDTVFQNITNENYDCSSQSQQQKNVFSVSLDSKPTKNNAVVSINRQENLEKKEQENNVEQRDNECNTLNVGDKDSVSTKENEHSFQRSIIETSKEVDVSDEKELSNEQQYYDFDLQEEKEEQVVNEINVIEESIKQDVKDMSYNQLYELVKARNLLSGVRGRPSKAKLIELLADDSQ